MYYLSKKKERDYKTNMFKLISKNNRLMILFIASLIATIIFINLAYIASKAEHHCKSEKCNICIQVEAVIDHIKNIGTSINFIPIIILAFVIKAVVIVKEANEYISHLTLISLKVRLDI